MVRACPGNAATNMEIPMWDGSRRSKDELYLQHLSQLVLKRKKLPRRMVESLIFLFTYNSEAQKIEECF